MLLSGQGELHLNVAKWKLENLYKLKVDFEKPRISFRETIQQSVQATYRHKKQESGGAGQFAEVHMLVDPCTKECQHPQVSPPRAATT